ncbi:hypothetical protein HG536_0E00390 [Torulaspora globosa]|uniref:Sodium/calcium exchanger membrane region domain-containing protein n=1 Tax=Torulaspora globosa TaxID=48254 RepID=A0A7G3ZHZ3_9SACH|nr:uncharacterized protein HG536_0E00390 [Torulaspora globosa]QLL33129.1 hypothetical protein HG536_0E00390 [Torulaspora globosa]
MPKDHNPLHSLHSNGTIGSSNAPDHVYRVFSVDDDPDEIEHDVRYLEGLHDGLKYALHNSKSKGHLLPSATSDGNGQHSKSKLKTKTKFRTSPKKKSVSKSRKDADGGGPSKISIPPLGAPQNASNIDVEPDANKFVIHDHPSGIGHDLIFEDRNIDEENGPGDDERSTTSMESYTLRERQDAINETHPFGIRIWKPALYKKQRSVQKVAAEDIHETRLKKITWEVHLSNILWAVSCGTFLFLLMDIAGVLVYVLGLFTRSSKEYALLCFRLGRYLLWPFGKVVYLTHDEHYIQEDMDEGISTQQFYNWVTSYSNRLFFHQSQAETNDALKQHGNKLQHPSYGSVRQHLAAAHEESPSIHGILSEHPSGTAETVEGYSSGTGIQRRYFGRGKWSWGRLIFYVLFHLLIQPIVFVISLVTWLAVFTIPMSNILWNLMYHCRRHPLALGFKYIKNTSAQDDSIIKAQVGKNVLLCTFRCAGWHYYKFTVDGTNVIVVNLMSLVLFTIFDFYVFKKQWHFSNWLTHEITIFTLCLASIIPLAFYIGQAVASISAQTSMGVGAVINAFFSTVVEIFLYCVALKQSKGRLVEGSMIGSILGAVLLLPGLSMCGGALNRKTQRYNPASAGVSSTMLIFSMIVMFVPTIFYEIYGSYTVRCEDDKDLALTFANISKVFTSERCYFTHPPLKYTKMYVNVIQPLSISCAIVLFLAYIIGLWFTLRTHAVMIWQLPITEQAKEMSASRTLESNPRDDQDVNDDGASSGHEAPNWSRNRSTCILLVATLLYAVIAEILVSCVDAVLEGLPSLNPKFLGFTIFALVPNTTEFLNAISFAMHGNVALSMEIGSAYALQVCLLQVPALVLYSVLYTWKMDISEISIRDMMFPLVFPKWDLIASMASVFLFTYLYAEGKSNYFKGSMLILLYVITVLGFYCQGIIEAWGPT